MKRFRTASGGRIAERWLQTSTTRSVIAVMIIVFTIHVVVSRIFDLPDAAGRYELLLGVAYFVFGLFTAFALENARNGLARVNELLKAGDADLISIYKLSASFGPAAQEDVRDSLDHHMQDQIDYRLADFDRSTPSFLDLFDQVRSLDPQTTHQEFAYDHLLGVLVSASERRKQLEALVRQRVSTVEWVTLLGLLGSLWGLMLTANGGPLMSSFLGGVLVASLAGIMTLLHHLDNFRWQEGDAIWKPLHTMFLALDLLPYYSRASVESGRIDPETGRLRVAHYPNPYPDVSDKRVEEITHIRAAR